MNRREKVRLGLTNCAAAWFADASEPNQSGVGAHVCSVHFKPHELEMLTNPGYWSIRGDGGQYGGVHLYTAECRLAPSNDTAEMEVVHLVPEGLMFVQSGRFHEFDGSEVLKHQFLGFKLLTEVREEALAIKIKTCKNIVSWYKSVYDLLEDSDIGTEDSDWEQLTSERASITDSAIISTWIRMKNRENEPFNPAEVESGTVEVKTEYGESAVRWLDRPVGKYAMTWGTKSEEIGVWS